jgi:hypothetical protein
MDVLLLVAGVVAAVVVAFALWGVWHGWRPHR